MHRIGFSSTATSFQDGDGVNFPLTAGHFLENYSPTTPKERPDGTYEPVTESVDVVFYGDTVTAMRERINAIERLLYLAREQAEDGIGVKYYITFYVDGDLAAGRSELISGRLELAGDVLRSFGQAQARARIIITRQPFWEQLRKEVRISTFLDGTGTGGKRIHNYRDTAASNYVAIEKGEILGVLPAPAQISLQNITGSDQGYRNWYISNNVWSDPVGFFQVREGENRRSGYGTIVNSGFCSNSQYVELPVNTSTSIIWDMSGTNSVRSGGHTFRLFMRLASVPPVTTYITPGIWDATGNIPLTPFRKEITISSTSSQLVDLGTMQIPPGLSNTSLQADTTLRFDVRSDSSTLLNIDYVHFFPTTGFRHLAQRGNLIPNNDYVVDDAIEGLAYSDELDGLKTSKHAIITPLESPVMLYPGRVQRLYILHDTDGGASVVANQTKVRLWYRPRFLTI